VACFHLPQAGGDVGQRADPVDDGPELPVLDQRGDGGELGAVLPGGQDAQPLPDDGVDRDQREHWADRADEMTGRAARVEHEGPGGRQRAAHLAQRAVADVVQDQVVAGVRLGEVLGRVVDDAGGAERAHELQVPGAAHAGDLRAERRGDLHGVAADAAGRAVDQHPVPGPRLADPADSAQRGGGRHRDRRSLLEREALRLGHEEFGPAAGVFGERARAEADNVLAGAQSAHVRADRLHPVGRVDAGHPGPGPGQSGAAHEPRDVGIAAQHVPVVGVEGRGVNPDQHVIGSDPGRLRIGEPQDVRRSEPVLDDCFHGLRMAGPR
jgi:hypothetical protein